MTGNSRGRDRSSIRRWLAAVVAGAHPAWPFDDQEDASAVLSVAEDEGVVALVDWRLRDAPKGVAVPAAVREGMASCAREKAVQSLIRENECRRLLIRLEAAGLSVLLLKGSALGYWAYASPHLRECADIDLLFKDRADAERALPILADLQYEPRDRFLPGDTVGFELTCVRQAGYLSTTGIDLHWRLASTPLFAFRFENAELWSSAIPLPRLAPNARGLAPVPAYLHACMHRVQNMAWGSHDTLKWLYDVHLLGSAFTSSQWREVLALVATRGLAGACGDGMDAAAEAFGQTAPDEVREALRASARTESMNVRRMHHWAYIEWTNFRAFPNLAMRMRWLRQRVVPDRAYLQDRYGPGTGYFRMMSMRLRAALARLRS